MSDPAPIRILSRASELARLQVDEALPFLIQALPQAAFVVDAMETIGDRDLVTPLTDTSVPQDFFSRELDRAQRDGEVDLVIHSAKDLPDPMPEGLVIAAMLPARETRDALVIREGVDLKEGGVIGTSSPVREAAMRKLYPNTTFKSIRGDIAQRLAQVNEGYDAVIIAACALERLGLSDHISEWLDYETTPLQGRLAITVSEDRPELIRALRVVDVRRNAGLVALVGCPADARLLGGLAKSLLEAADLVLHDRLIPDDILASLGDRGEYVGKKGHSHSTTQPHIHRRILHEAESGKLVVRLHGGEPGVLGHLGETLDYCKAWGLRTEVVPAVSAAQLTAARAQCSLTHRLEGRSITFLSGHKGLADHTPESLSPNHGHLAIYMGVRDIRSIKQNLEKAGWHPETPVTVGIRLGYDDEKIIYSTLNVITEEALISPAVMLIGPRSHFSSCTLFTGTDPSKFLRHGPLLPFPMIELSPAPLEERVSLLKERLKEWEGIIFPSSHSVKWFMEALLCFGDTRHLAGKQIWAVGPLTAQSIKRFGLRADAVPKGFGGAAALADLEHLKPGKYGYLTSNVSPVAERQEAFEGTGIKLDPTVFYTNQPTKTEKLPHQPFNRVLFTAGSTARAYFTKFPEERKSNREWLAVGSSTLNVLKDLGLEAHIVS